VLDERIEGFAAQDRFKHGVLGLLSVTEQVQALAASPSDTPGLPREGAIVDCLLGLISLGRSLRAAIACAPRRGRVAGPALPPDIERTGRILR
jgi:hypothetical protein